MSMFDSVGSLLMSACISAGSSRHPAAAVAVVKQHSTARQVLQGVLHFTALSCAMSPLKLFQKAMSNVVTAARLMQEASTTLQALTV